MLQQSVPDLVIYFRNPLKKSEIWYRIINNIFAKNNLYKPGQFAELWFLLKYKPFFMTKRQLRLQR